MIPTPTRTVRSDVVLNRGGAAYALLGDGFRFTEHRGPWLEIPAALHEVMSPDAALLARAHPLAVL
jgi:hypothetical protein